MRANKRLYLYLINKARMRLDESKQATEEKTRHAMTPLDMSLYDDVMNTSSTFNMYLIYCFIFKYISMRKHHLE